MIATPAIPSLVAEPLAAAAVDLAERGAPDRVVRAGMRAAIGRRLATERRRDPMERVRWLEEWSRGPIALVPDQANEQHYEVPAAFFELILGPRLKYSSGLWAGGDDLAAAELAMLDLTIDRAGVADGMTVLDLGCGWGSISLRLAERFPSARVVAVSNSTSQGAFIADRARALGLDNLTHRVVDVNCLAATLGPGPGPGPGPGTGAGSKPGTGLIEPGRFDRVISVEMLEHVRNHRALLSTLATLLAPGGEVYVHVFAHRELYWPFEDDGAANWMTRYFFSGGIMPSADLFERITATDEVGLWAVDRRWFNGTHYANTLDAWLDRIDANRDRVHSVLRPVYGPDTDRWIQRWRMFMMACSELFGYDGGDEWGVVHTRLSRNL